ncbi:MAG TPA: HEPN domain-containing protein [Arachnia sp.]|nr:HEPN domain-containing protein [Arachnia sp.]
MPRWKRGESVIERLVRAGSLDVIGKSASDGSAVLAQAGRRLRIAEAALEIDPDGAYTNAYDAARLAATALLTQQGLRPTTSGGHRAVEEALLAQFGPGFSKFSVLRRRRHELDYPGTSYSEASDDEARDAVETARLFLETAERILPELGFFSD